MAQSKHQFYRKGADVQKRADVTVDLRRVDRKEIENWTPEQKESFNKWLDKVKSQFNIFYKELKPIVTTRKRKFNR